MTDTWLLWLSAALALTALIEVIRLQHAHERHQREVQVKLAALTRVVESIRGKESLLNVGLTPDEIHALANLKRRQLARTRRIAVSPAPKPPEGNPHHRKGKSDC